MSGPIIHDDGKTNPLIVIPRQMLLDWLREVADKAGYSDRASSAVQSEFEIRFPGQLISVEADARRLPLPVSNDGLTAFYYDAPTLTVMVSNIPNSREAPELEGQHLYHGDAFADIRDRIALFRDTCPEDDESWESWYFAAFDMLGEEVRQIIALDKEAKPKGIDGPAKG